MIEIGFLRHGRTAWNLEGRLQGRADEPLSTAGRAELAGRRLPPPFDRAPCLVSPLQRARETAQLIGRGDAAVEPALIEMDWGAYQGRTVAELRAELGAAFAANEARGLDFTPPGGESPREVAHRLLAWLQGLDDAGGIATLLAISHKGVIRAAAAVAADWAMVGKPPVRFDWRCLQVFRYADGRLVLTRANVALPGERRAEG